MPPVLEDDHTIGSVCVQGGILVLGVFIDDECPFHNEEPMMAVIDKCPCIPICGFQTNGKRLSWINGPLRDANDPIEIRGVVLWNSMKMHRQTVSVLMSQNVRRERRERRETETR